jgi:hypothetical protein
MEDVKKPMKTSKRLQLAAIAILCSAQGLALV